MKTNHTQGNWTLRGNKIFIEDTYKSIATIHVVKNHKDITFEPIEDVEAEANARLITAAPELLECLHGILKSGYYSTEWGNRSIDAIKKATNDNI